MQVCTHAWHVCQMCVCVCVGDVARGTCDSHWDGTTLCPESTAGADVPAVAATAGTSSMFNFRLADMCDVGEMPAWRWRMRRRCGVAIDGAESVRVGWVRAGSQVWVRTGMG